MSNKYLFISFLTLLVMTCFSSCNKNDEVDDVSYSDPNLIGVWSFDSVTFQGKDSVLIDTDSVTIDKVELTINSDGTINSGTLYNGSYTIIDQNGRVHFEIKRSDFSGVPTPFWIEVLMKTLNEAEYYKIQELHLKVEDEIQIGHFEKIIE